MEDREAVNSQDDALLMTAVVFTGTRLQTKKKEKYTQHYIQYKNKYIYIEMHFHLSVPLLYTIIMEVHLQ